MKGIDPFLKNKLQSVDESAKAGTFSRFKRKQSFMRTFNSEEKSPIFDQLLNKWKSTDEQEKVENIRQRSGTVRMIPVSETSRSRFDRARATFINNGSPSTTTTSTSSDTTPTSNTHSRTTSVVPSPVTSNENVPEKSSATVRNTPIHKLTRRELKSLGDLPSQSTVRARPFAGVFEKIDTPIDYDNGSSTLDEAIQQQQQQQKEQEIKHPRLPTSWATDNAEEQKPIEFPVSEPSQIEFTVSETNKTPLYAQDELTPRERTRTVRGREGLKRPNRVLTRSGLPVFEEDEEVESTLRHSTPIDQPQKAPNIRYINPFRNGLKKKKDLEVLDYHRKEIARQMALIDFELFSRIEAKEFLDQGWTGDEKEICAPNITRITQRFNTVSLWVATEIVRRERMESRAKAICKFIKIARRSLDINNYHAMIAVMAGLGSNPVYRLRNTWECVPSDYIRIYEELCTYTSHKDNFKLLRTTMRDRPPPGIPHMGLYLKDLMFIEDGVPDQVVKNDKEMINFAKGRQFATILRDVQIFQKHKYIYEPFEELRNLLLNLVVFDEERLYELSLIREERATVQFD
jgi:hypothetical protein